MDDFFEQGEYQQAQQPVIYNQDGNEETQQTQWEQAEIQSSTQQSSALYAMGGQNAYQSGVIPNLGSSSMIEVDVEVTRKIAEEEDKINQVLREKSDKEYEEKQARKAAGREQLENFFAQKERELQERKQQNIEHERNLIEKAKQLTQKAGWEKVFQNVNLKMGEYQGSKSVNRMRESIINKHEDDKNSK